MKTDCLGCRSSECGCLTLFIETTPESGETVVSLEPNKLVMWLHLAKIMIDGKVIPNEIISYKFIYIGSRDQKPQHHLLTAFAQ